MKKVNYEMTTYLVTGGAGFIGSHIVEELIKREYKVRIIDNFSTGKKENLHSFLDKIELINGDIRNFKLCMDASEGVDFVFHQAALSSVPCSIENPVLTNEININGTLNLLLASLKAKVKRFIFASSAAVYGDDPHIQKKEGREGNTLSPYAGSKLIGEKYCQVFSRVYGLSTVCLRYFNVFGPRQDPFSQYAAVIPNFIMKIIRKENPTIFGDGEQSRDFIYISNIVNANLLALKAHRVSGKVFNIAFGERITIKNLALEINRILSIDVRPCYTEPRLGDVRHSFADISKAKKILKYEPRVGFKEGLERTISWYIMKGSKE